MAADIVAALSRFSETLADTKVDGNAKLKVLQTLSDVPLTLNELSQSGVGRAVRRLKGQPGQLGLVARDLIIKWKSLLDEHIKRENISISSTGPPVVEKRKSDQSITLVKEEEKKRKKQKHHHQHVEEQEAKRPVSKISMDSSSGFSFEQVLCVPTAAQLQKKKKIKKTRRPPVVDDSINVPSASSYTLSPIPATYRPTCKFTDEILASLSEPVDRPDTFVEPKVVSRFPAAFEDDPDDGNLKFKSMQIKWAPKPKKNAQPTVANGNSTINSSTSHNSYSPKCFQPSSLIDLCLGVLQRNINLIDHVSNVPFELFSQVLANTSADELRRIETYNPQFVGLNEDAWQRHVQHDFPEMRGMQPRHKETWATMYARLVQERDCRLKMFVNRTTKKLEAEKESRRIIQRTDVITPAAFRRRRNARLIAHSSTSSYISRQGDSRHRNAPTAKMVFKPRNMSRPDPYPSSGASNSNSAEGGGSGNSTGQNDMLSKIRKQFLKGR